MSNWRQILLCSSWLALASTAYAEPPSVRDAATAEALFRQGRQSLDDGRYLEACPKFAESQRLDPAAGTLMNLAACEEKLNKLASAWQHWREAIDALPPGDDRMPFAQSRVTALEKRLPRLTIEVAGPLEPTSKVMRDETEIGPAGRGVPLPVDPGNHTVVLSTPGRLDGTASVSLREGESQSVSVAMGAFDPVAAERIAGRESGATSSKRTAGWAAGAVGVAGLAAAATTGFMLLSKRNTVETECQSDSKQCTDVGYDAAATGKTLLVVNTISWVVAAAGLGVGTYLVLSSVKSQPTAVLAPTVGPTGGALSWVGTF